jgi:SulP family sulfate permease
VVTRWGVVSSALFALGIVTASGPLLEKIPLPALAALIMWVSLKLIGLKSIRIALTATHSDALVYLTTFLAAIFLRLDYAIYLGVLVSMGLFLQKASVPRLMEFEFDEQGRFRRADKDKKSAMPQISIVHVEGELFFGAAETLEEEILRSIDRDSTKVIILRLRNAHNLDASGVMVLAQMIRDLRETGIHVLISGTNPEVDRVIQRAGFEQIIGKENYFPSQENFLEATRRAVFRAHEIVGVKSPVIRLFYDKDQEQARTQPATGSPP